MITRGDDYPLHQTAEPIAFSGTDRNFYDRYFFNGQSDDGETFFAAALGVYPQLNVMDAAFSVVRGGTQHNVRASRILHMERTRTEVGPVSVEVVTPLEELRVGVDAGADGVRADLRFRARGPVLEEPRFQRRNGTRVFFDYTRMTQHGLWDGFLEVAGERIAVTPERFRGVRDRSWGIRPVGASDPQPIVPPELPQFYWLWAPLHFDDEVFLYDVAADGAGTPWHHSAIVAPAAGVSFTVCEPSVAQLAFRPGTRHAARASLAYRRPDGREGTIDLVPGLRFFMSGIGYLHPEWGHGVFPGDDVSTVDSFRTDEVDAIEPRFLHVQAVCDAVRREGGREERGRGVLEQLILGPHAPSGFRDLLDVAP